MKLDQLLSLEEQIAQSVMTPREGIGGEVRVPPPRFVLREENREFCAILTTDWCIAMAPFLKRPAPQLAAEIAQRFHESGVRAVSAYLTLPFPGVDNEIPNKETLSAAMRVRKDEHVVVVSEAPHQNLCGASFLRCTALTLLHGLFTHSDHLAFTLAGDVVTLPKNNGELAQLWQDIVARSKRAEAEKLPEKIALPAEGERVVIWLSQGGFQHYRAQINELRIMRNTRILRTNFFSALLCESLPQFELARAEGRVGSGELLLLASECNALELDFGVARREESANIQWLIATCIERVERLVPATEPNQAVDSAESDNYLLPLREDLLLVPYALRAARLQGKITQFLKVVERLSSNSLALLNSPTLRQRIASGTLSTIEQRTFTHVARLLSLLVEECWWLSNKP